MTHLHQRITEPATNTAHPMWHAPLTRHLRATVCERHKTRVLVGEDRRGRFAPLLSSAHQLTAFDECGHRGLRLWAQDVKQEEAASE